MNLETQHVKITISNDPRNTPHSTLLNHRPPSRTSSGSSTNSARGFSSRVNVKKDPVFACGVPTVLLGRLDDGCGGAPCVTVGVIFRNDLKPTYKEIRR